MCHLRKLQAAAAVRMNNKANPDGTGWGQEEGEQEPG